MYQWINFQAGENDAWSLGWSALATVGTFIAIASALFIHFHHQSVSRREGERRRKARTIAVAPQLAADAMRLNWEIAQSLRVVRGASRLELTDRAAALVEAWKLKAAGLYVQPGAEVHGADIEWLVDPVREKLAALKAQVTVCNAMWQRLLLQSFEPFASREEAIGEMLKGATHQLVDTNTSCIALLEVLGPYLPEPLNELQIGLKREAVHFLSIFNEVPYTKRKPRGT